MDSMLITIKRLLGISETDEHFDIDVITNINSTLVKVQQLGIGPSTGFRITSKDEEWSDLLGDRLDLESVKTYIYLNEGEEFCRKCDGKGRIFDKRRYFSNVKIVKSLICSTCLGTGKLDWIEKVVGKNNNHKVSEHR
jgi:hypothetical protein